MVKVESTGQVVEHLGGDSDISLESDVSQENSGTEAQQEKNKKDANVKADAKSLGLTTYEVEVKPRSPVEITLRSLLESGVHFGHQTSRWNPAMAPYIYTARNGVHIINLPYTMQCWKQVREFVANEAAKGKSFLFVGTKKQAQSTIAEEATRAGAYYVSRRWLGGMLTNFKTIRRGIDRMKKIEQILADEDIAQKEGTATKYTKKERLLLAREHGKLDFALGGIRDMYTPPQVMFVVDVKREDIAIKEAARLDIPVIALVDTNCDPNTVDHVIPSNDDGSRAIQLFASAMADAIVEGKSKYVKQIPKTTESGKKKSGPAASSNGESAEA